MSSDLLARIRSTPHRGRTHIFLGDPRSDQCDKTTVEPGNVFSPGLWTCGIAVWVGGLSPEHLPAADIAWRLEPPCAISIWRVGAVQVEHRLAHLGTEGAEGIDAALVRISAPTAQRVWIAVRETGPAGGAIARLAWADGCLCIDGAQLVPERAPDQVLVERDVAALGFDLPAGGGEIAFRVRHGFAQRICGGMAPRVGACDHLDAAALHARAAAEWRTALPARIVAPDPRVAAGWERCAWHLLAAAEGGLPRIGIGNYPTFWQRDGVIILHAFDLLGRPDLARIGCDALAPHIFGGGFGAEADAPGAGIWALVQHALITGDQAWLARRFEAIAERAGWIVRMLATDRPLRHYADGRKPDLLDSPGSAIVCLAAVDGTVKGRMDHHHPDFYINCWCWAGLSLAAQAADLLGRPEAAAWRVRAERLSAAIATHLLPAYGNARDPAVAPWPSGWTHPGLADAFQAHWRQHRVDAAGGRRPEPHWTYFEAASANNAQRLGQAEAAWTSLSGMLDPIEGWEVADHHEGPPGGGEQLPFGNGAGRRGWLGAAARAGNMPHNWTTAEMVCALRDLFVREEDGGLLLGAGVPAAWRVPGSRWGVTDLPTAYGTVSYTACVGADGVVALDYRGPQRHRLA